MRFSFSFVVVLVLGVSGCGDEGTGFCEDEPVLTPCPRKDGSEGYCSGGMCCEATFDAATGDLEIHCE